MKTLLYCIHANHAHAPRLPHDDLKLRSPQAPTAADVRAAISAEAQRRGVTMRTEPSAAPGGGAMGARGAASMLFGGGGAGGVPDLNTMDTQLMGLIEALEGRLGLLRNGAAAAAAAAAASGAGGGGDTAAAQVREFCGNAASL